MALAREPNESLVKLMEEARIGNGELARAVCRVGAQHGHSFTYGPSTVTYWRQGTTPRKEVVPVLCEVLGRRLGRPLLPQDIGLSSPDSSEDTNLGLSLGSDPVGTFMLLGRADLERRSFLVSAAYSVAASVLPLTQVEEIADRAESAKAGKVSGAAEVDAVRDMINMFTIMDEKHGGQHGRTALIQYLMTDVSAMLQGRFRTSEHLAQMRSAAAVGIHLCGWKAYDSGEQGLAQRYYQQAYSLARKSGVPGHDAFVLRTMAQQGMKLKHPQYVLAIAEEARSRSLGKVDAQTDALFTITLAHTMAGAGRNRDAVRYVEEAHHLLAEAPGDEQPFWATSWGPAAATVRSRTAKVYAKVGDTRAAAKNYAAAAAARPAGNYSRIHALDLNAQAKVELADGLIEQACATWGRSLDSMEGVHSARTLKAVQSMRRRISPFQARGVSAARELDERAHTVLRDMA